MGIGDRMIRQCTAEDFEALVEFVSRLNPIGTHHIGYFGVTPEDIRASIAALDFPFDQGFQLAYDSGRLVGVMGIDCDPDIGRAWLYGPVVDAEDWSPTADALYAALWSLMPTAIREHEMFVDVENVRCREFAARHAFVQHSEAAIYFIRPDRMAGLPAAEASAWDDRFTEALAGLHSRLFPNSNYTVPYMTGRLNEHNFLLLATDDDALTGYLFATYDPESGEAYIDLVGVAESHQRQGIGRRLLLAALARLGQYPGFKQANLTVDRHNTPALSLYDSLGFVRERDMVAFRRIVN